MKQEIQQRISAFVQLGKVFRVVAGDGEWPGFECGLTKEEFDGYRHLMETHHHSNGWFTPQNVRNAMNAWADSMTDLQLENFVAPYLPEMEKTSPKTVAIVCAGNIPMVGWHDVLCTLLCGHKALIKLSSDDAQLIQAALIVLEKFWPTVVDKYAYAQGKMENFDMVIATGSNNTGRYFEHYFGTYPHIIRKSRTSVAILDGTETKEELAALGQDIFAYFGLGCRNVTKIYMPEGYDINRVFEAIYPFNPIINHNKYANNYDYNKAIWLLNKEDLLENGFILFKQDAGLSSPTGSMYYEYYSDEAVLRAQLAEKEEQIQCIVSKKDIAFGGAQCPGLTDFADNVDTMKFLLS